MVRQYEKLLLGGIWAIIEMEYDSLITVGSGAYPFLVRDIKPIQLSSFDNTRVAQKRKEFTKEEWKKLLPRSAGYEIGSEGLDERKQNLLLCRLIPLVEKNFNMVELGPRSSGKSYIYKEITPYAILVSGGQGTVAQLFVNNSTGRVGAVGLWDAICFDESTDKLFRAALTGQKREDKKSPIPGLLRMRLLIEIKRLVNSKYKKELLACQVKSRTIVPKPSEILL